MAGLIPAFAWKVVSIVPGAIPTTRTPRGANSAAVTDVSMSTEALLIQ